jgi:hypothetical protein
MSLLVLVDKRIPFNAPGTIQRLQFFHRKPHLKRYLDLLPGNGTIFPIDLKSKSWLRYTASQLAPQVAWQAVAHTLTYEEATRENSDPGLWSCWRIAGHQNGS